MEIINKRGMSAIIVTLLLVMLSIVLVGIVWAVINNMVSKQMSSSSACFNINTPSLNDRYTCFNTTSTPKKVQFSLNVGDVDLSGVVVSITNADGSQTFTITNQSSQVAGVTNYSGGNTVQLPGKNSGETYFYNWTSSKAPDSIEISPVVGSTTCPSTDSINTISDCSQLY